MRSFQSAVQRTAHLLGVQSINLFDVSSFYFDIRNVFVCKEDFAIPSCKALGKILPNAPSSKYHIDCSDDT